MKSYILLVFMTLTSLLHAGFYGGGGSGTGGGKNTNAAIVAEYSIGNSGSSFTANWINGYDQSVTLNSATPSATFSNPADGTYYHLRVIQDATAGRVLALPSGITYPGGHGIVWSTCAGCWDDVGLLYRNGTYSVISHILFDPNADSIAYSMSFSGSGQYANAGDSADWTLGNHASFTGWFYFNAFTGTPVMISHYSSASNNPGFEWDMQTSGKAQLFIGVSGGSTTVNDSGSAITTGGWHFLALTYDQTLGSNNVKFYVDGSLNSQGNCTRTIPATGGEPLLLGAGNPVATPVQLFNGYMTQVSIYSTTLSGGNITTLYNSTRPIDQINASTALSGLLSWWRFQPPDSTSSITDQKSAHNASITGSPTFSTKIPNPQNPFAPY